MDELEEIRQKISIVDFIAESVALKKAGRNFKGLCPFHNERTPSFVVSPERQIWHCFGCSKGGDCFSFLMELDRLEFPEALEILARRTGVTLTRKQTDDTAASLKKRLLALHHLAAEYYTYLFTKHPIGARAREYLKERGVSEKVSQTFSLGFAPNSWENLTRYLFKKGFTYVELETSGLSLRGRSGWYDRFRDRIIFPLKNYRGETIGFSGRVLLKSATEAKYINSPETPIYHKGDMLYGLDITKEAIRKNDGAIIMEGEFDVISSFQAGVGNVVAIKGSALTPAQVHLVKRFTERIYLALDQDVAGDSAARRGIEIADEAGLDIRVINIPGGKDPDESARENPGVWKEATTKAIPVFDFLIDSAFKRLKGDDAFSKKKISDELLPVLAKINNTIIKAHYTKVLAGRLDISEEKVGEALGKVRQPRSFSQDATQDTEVKPIPEELFEEHTLGLILQMQDIKKGLERLTHELDPSDFFSGVVRKIFMALIDYSAHAPTMAVSEFTKSLPQELLPTVDRAFLTDFSAFTTDELLAKELDNTIKIVKRTLLRRKIATLSTTLAQLQKEGTSEEFVACNTKLLELTAALKSVS